MDHREAGAFWERAAPAWTKLARQGYDVCRDFVNTPAFLGSLPDVSGLAGLDIGCGEGHNTRELAALGADMISIDIVRYFARATRDGDGSGSGGLPVAVASAVALPFPAAAFDFATAFMSLQDVPETEACLAEAARVLRNGGFLQFSITHPCTDTPHRRPVRGPDGHEVALEIGRYYDEEDPTIFEWLFGAAPPEAREGLEPFRIPRIHRTLSRWLNAIVGAGLAIEWVEEPTVSAETAARVPRVKDTRILPYFLHIRARKARASGPGSPEDRLSRPARRTPRK